MKKDYRGFAVDLAERAGEIIRTNHMCGDKPEWKGDATPLTLSDRKINQLVLEEIEKTFPSHSVIAEEGSNLTKSEFTWICDPIDGTVPFSHGWPTSVFVLALTHHGESILGVIYDPYVNRMVVAEKGKGAFVNGNKMQVSSTKTLANTVVDVEAWKGAYIGVSVLHKELINKNCHSVAIRSTSYATMLVACGELAGVVSTCNSPWDGAAGKVIVEEAGGKMTDLYGNEQRYDATLKGILVSNGLLHETLTAMIKPLI